MRAPIVEPQDAIPPEHWDSRPPRPGTASLPAPLSLLLAVLLPPVGMAFGIAALIQIRRSRQLGPGLGLAVAGVAVGALLSLACFALYALLFSGWYDFAPN